MVRGRHNIQAAARSSHRPLAVDTVSPGLSLALAFWEGVIFLSSTNCCLEQQL